MTERAGPDDPLVLDSHADGALIDPATALPGERLAFEHLDRSIALARRQHWGVGVLSIGPARATDAFAGELVERLQRVVRASDFLARPGRAEFVVVLTALAAPNDVDIVATRLLLVLASRVRDRTADLERRRRGIPEGRGCGAAAADDGTASSPGRGGQERRLSRCLSRRLARPRALCRLACVDPPA